MSMIKEKKENDQVVENSKQFICRLRQEISDLEIALLTAVEHGDSIEEELMLTNSALKQEAVERQKAEDRLKKLVTALTQQKDDLEMLVQTITEHGDDLQYEWLERIDAAEEEALTDALTSIANRRCFDQYIESEWRRASRSNSCFSIIMIDIDYFKLFNDFYGHQAGDDCIRKIASATKDICTREGDLLARYGGEEFAAILPATDHKGALLIADRLLKAVEDLQIQHQASKAAEHVTISVGIASSQAVHGIAASELIKLADDMLYKAKELGRNQIVGAIKESN